MDSALPARSRRGRDSVLPGWMPAAGATIYAANIEHVAEAPRARKKPFQLAHPRSQSLQRIPYNHSTTKSETLHPSVERKLPRAHVRYSLLEHLNDLYLNLYASKVLRRALPYFILKTQSRPDYTPPLSIAGSRIHVAATSLTRLATETGIPQLRHTSRCSTSIKTSTREDITA